MMKRLTPVEIAKAVRNPCSNILTKLSPAAIVGNIGPYVKATFVKMENKITGNCRAGIFARKTFTNQMFAKSQTAHTL